MVQQSELIARIETEATIAPCTSCGHENMIPITPNNNNDFECISCGEMNGVYVNITIAQKTVPIDAEPYEVTSFNSSKNNIADVIKADTSNEEQTA